ncbi:hypothetical protein A1QO_02535 [Vibrio genomosp. F10 str. ZF-129]|uniref:Uncharacterized protein n=1 Tax=Vibrio genomosp. F10 str. ZF-129 TaxID=1187848 RepID=A0A1E5BK87_9VIBR|nr:hypothetical protein [Vibrio genomosp. F10]OEE38274.1 hypothetical protein A1QO_02535 [Vibrio genomosp. F10 str. ZF-129]
MKIGLEFNTDKGIASVVGTTAKFVYSVHLSPMPVKGSVFSGEITIVTANIDTPEVLETVVRFNDVVEHAARNFDMTLSNGNVIFSSEECREIQKEVWSVLIKKYRLGPTELITPSTSTAD